jgi:AcrR family transcriptional regulator
MCVQVITIGEVSSPSHAHHLPRARRRDAAENRAAILVAAATTLNNDSGATLEAIAAEAGFSRRAIYGHFATRDELIRELIARGAERVAHAVTGITVTDSRIAIAQIGERLWREVDGVRVMAQFAVRGPFAEEVGRALAPTRKLLHDAVDMGIRSGELRQDINAALLTRLIEGAALAVLDEATKTALDHNEGARLVMTAGLAMAGLSWTECQATINEMERSV